MNGFFYGAALQWRLDLRSRTMLIACYAVPLLFFAVMGGIFTSVLPESRDTLVQSMTTFAVSMGALIGLPPSLAEIYGRDIKNVYQANGVPLSMGLILTNVSAFVHLLLMSLLLYAAAPAAFNAKIPEHPAAHFCGTAILIAVSLSIASVIGLAVKDTASTTLFSILLFLPSIMLSGIMFPMDLLPGPFAAVGRLFPATWGYTLLTEGFSWSLLGPLAGIFLAAAGLCIILLRKVRMR